MRGLTAVRAAEGPIRQCLPRRAGAPGIQFPAWLWRRLRATLCPVVGLLLSGALVAFPAVSEPAANAPAGWRDGKIGRTLTRLYDTEQAEHLSGLPELLYPLPNLAPRGGGYVTLDTIAIDGDGKGLLLELEALGLRHGASFKHMASGRFPIANLPLLEGVSKLRSAQPFYTLAYAGTVQSQGDAAMGAAAVRLAYGLDGSGVTVGAISTSFNCIDPGNNQAGANEIGYPEDIASGNLPAGIQNLQELDSIPGGSLDCEPETLATDEGRAMLQVVYDVAPGATLKFHSGANGQADFAQGILALRDAGANVIVDDLGVANEPFFQDGIIAQAIDEVVGDGVTYLAAGGNWGSYALAANATGRWTTDPQFGLTAFDFDPGAGVDHYLRIRVPAISGAADASAVIFLLHWDQPYASATGGDGANSDLALYVTNSAATSPFRPTGSSPANVCGVGSDGSPNGDEANEHHDPLEVLQFVNASGILFGGPCGLNPTEAMNFNLYIRLKSGPQPAFITLMVLAPVIGPASPYGVNGQAVGFQVLDSAFFPGGSTVFGHANAARALTVGAVNYDKTPAFGQTPPLIANYSSRGPGVPILFGPNDARLADPVVRAKPELICPDGADISFNPCGTYSSIGTAYLCFNAVDTSDSGSFPNFFGTSAAAAHCAGGAALLLEKEPSLFPQDVYNALQSASVDMGTPGFDSDSGWGLVGLGSAATSLDCGDVDGFNLILTSGSESGTTTRESCNAIYASGYTIEATADVLFQAGNRVVLGNGFHVQAGALFSTALN
jgi:Subtilase family